MKLKFEHVEYIRNLCADGQSREEIFHALNKRLGNSELPLDHVEKRFQYFKNGKRMDEFVWSEGTSLFCGIILEEKLFWFKICLENNDLYTEETLVCAIEFEFQRQRAYFEFLPMRSYPITYSILTLDERYQVFVGVVTKQTRGLILYDTFHGKKR
jgi:hypothetical protein